MKKPVVFVADEQSDHPVDTGRWLTLANAVLSAESVPGGIEVSIIYVDETSIARLNEQFLGKSGSTDVLSFPIDEMPNESGRVPDSGGRGPGGDHDHAEDDDEVSLLGDVLICPSVAARNAPEHAGTYDDEMALLLVHGLLHLIGMDHEQREDAERMESRERELLGRFHGELPVSAWPQREAGDDGQIIDLDRLPLGQPEPGDDPAPESAG